MSEDVEKIPSVIRIAIDSWMLGLSTALLLPKLIISTLLIGLPCEIAMQFCFRHWLAQLSDHVQIRIIIFVGYFLHSLILSNICIAISRAVLINEHIDRYVWNIPKNYLTYLKYSVLITCAFLPEFLLWITTDIFGIRFGHLLSLLLAIAAIVFEIRMYILFPAISISSLGASIKNSWRDSRTHFWKMFSVSFLVGLPGIGGVLLRHQFLTPPHISIAEFNDPKWIIFHSALVFLPNAIIVCVGSVAGSRLFKLYAVKLNEIPSNMEG